MPPRGPAPITPYSPESTPYYGGNFALGGYLAVFNVLAEEAFYMPPVGGL